MITCKGESYVLKCAYELMLNVQLSICGPIIAEKEIKHLLDEIMRNLPQ